MRHLHPAHLFFVAFLLLFFLYPDNTTSIISDITSMFSQYLGGFVLLSCIFFVGLCAYIAFGRYGHIRLGAQDERPQFSTLSWFSMLFAAGMGAGLLFYGSAEPLQHFHNPPPSLAAHTSIPDQARHAMVLTYLHWGIHAWAIYATAALCIAYFTFRAHKVMLPSAAITDKKPVRMVIDTIAILAVIFGIVSSLLHGVAQVLSGFSEYFGIETTQIHGVIVLTALFICFMASAATPLGKGIKILSNINILIAFLLMIFVFSIGQTSFIFDLFIAGIGDYIQEFVFLSFNVRPFVGDNKWTEDWTITYLLWWISWSPFVGVFIARISRGRTLREFICAVVLLPTIVSLFWFAIFGGSALYFDMFSNIPFTEIQRENFESMIFVFMSKFPLSEVTSLVTIILIFIFLVTSADSGTFVLGMFTSGGSLEPSVRQRLFWGIVIGLVSFLVFTTSQDLAFFRALSTLGAVTYLFIMLCQSFIFIKEIRKENLDT